MDIDTLTTHAAVWAKLNPMLAKHRLPHALLFIGPRHANILLCVNHLMAILMCQHPTSVIVSPVLDGETMTETQHTDTRPCGECKPCHLLRQGTHPDIQYVRQDTPSSPIKIEQIRALQDSLYQTPQCGLKRIIVIEPADRLNRAAANALLKILEEPPSHTLFILIAEQIGSLPPTIISRCQQYTVCPPELCEPIEQIDYLTMGKFYPEGSERAVLFSQCESLMDDWCEMLENNISPCTLAAKWSSFALEDLLWFLYLLTSQAIRHQFMNSVATQPWTVKLQAVSKHMTPVDLFQQLDNINALLSTVRANITLNQTLAIETIRPHRAAKAV